MIVKKKITSETEETDDDESELIMQMLITIWTLQIW